MSWFKEAIEEILGLGVRDFCLCAGKRNAPLISVLEGVEGVRLWRHFEERSAAFFALGRARKERRPVAVVTTSGTAVGELLPAVMEAYYLSVPLVLITADRPRAMRGSGAPQACEQKGIFGLYAKSYDIEEGESFSLNWEGLAPLQINLCLQEPKELPTLSLSVESSPWERELPPVPMDAVQNFVEKHPQLEVVVSTLAPHEREPVKAFLLSLRAPVYFEAPSGLREDRKLSAIALRTPPELRGAILKIGGVPTFRSWRDVGSQPLLSLSETSFCGTAGGTHYQVDLTTLRPLMTVHGFVSDEQGLEELFEKYPLAEPSLMHFLSKQVNRSERVYLGNSLPIREWDMAASYQTSSDIWASRGLNGIDGQISTALGLEADWIILGDLTALYDLSGLWLADFVKRPFRLVVINNAGGQIFKRVGLGENFINPHAMNFSAAAALWQIPYVLWSAGEVPYGLVEVVPCPSQTEEFWNEKNRLPSRLSRATH